MRNIRRRIKRLEDKNGHHKMIIDWRWDMPDELPKGAIVFRWPEEIETDERLKKTS